MLYYRKAAMKLKPENLFRFIPGKRRSLTYKINLRLHHMFRNFSNNIIGNRIIQKYRSIFIVIPNKITKGPIANIRMRSKLCKNIIEFLDRIFEYRVQHIVYLMIVQIKGTSIDFSSAADFRYGYVGVFLLTHPIQKCRFNRLYRIFRTSVHNKKFRH